MGVVMVTGQLECNSFDISPSYHKVAANSSPGSIFFQVNSLGVSEQRFNVPLDTLWVISGTIFYRPDDPTNSVKALKEASWPLR